MRLTSAVWRTLLSVDRRASNKAPAIIGENLWVTFSSIHCLMFPCLCCTQCADCVLSGKAALHLKAHWVARGHEGRTVTHVDVGFPREGQGETRTERRGAVWQNTTQKEKTSIQGCRTNSNKSASSSQTKEKLLKTAFIDK